MSENDRLDALYATKILELGREERYDRITRLAARALDSKMALISLVDADQQIFKSAHGLDKAGTPRNVSFCHHAILTPNLMVVPDTAQDERFKDNPLVTGEPNIGFYAGMPLITAEGQALGTLCILDTEPCLDFSDQDRQILMDLAATVMSEIESTSQGQIIDDLTLVNEELRHRMGNMYAHVSALVSLMGRNEVDKDRLVLRLREKITMLAETQNLLANYEWNRVPLSALISTTLSPFLAAGDDDRIDIQAEGDFFISPRGAFILSLMLNELGTNAVKHGALGTPDGKVSFGWTNGGDEINFTWQESLTIPREANASGTGFGSQILKRIVPMDLQGQAVYDLSDTGLTYKISAKSDRIKYAPLN